MKALVVYKSMFGNTQAVARAVADGIATHGSVDVREVASAPDLGATDADLVVVGAPTHAFSLSRAGTRQDAATKSGRQVISEGRGVREWLEACAVWDAWRWTVRGRSTSRASKALWRPESSTGRRRGAHTWHGASRGRPPRLGRATVRRLEAAVERPSGRGPFPHRRVATQHEQRRGPAERVDGASEEEAEDAQSSERCGCGMPASRPRTSSSLYRRCPPRVRMAESLPALAQRVTVFGSTRNMPATSDGVRSAPGCVGVEV